jgi:hypothetical protein
VIRKRKEGAQMRGREDDRARPPSLKTHTHPQKCCLKMKAWYFSGCFKCIKTLLKRPPVSRDQPPLEARRVSKKNSTKMSDKFLLDPLVAKSCFEGFLLLKSLYFFL